MSSQYSLQDYLFETKFLTLTQHLLYYVGAQINLFC
jgi:hypothetical protein